MVHLIYILPFMHILLFLYQPIEYNPYADAAGDVDYIATSTGRLA